eukprot:26530-Pleurochrysis_carterae.AAC.4
MFYYAGMTRLSEPASSFCSPKVAGTSFSAFKRLTFLESFSNIMIIYISQRQANAHPRVSEGQRARPSASSSLVACMMQLSEIVEMSLSVCCIVGFYFIPSTYLRSHTRARDTDDRYGRGTRRTMPLLGGADLNGTASGDPTDL